MLWPIDSQNTTIPDDEYALLFRLYDGSLQNAFRNARPRIGVTSGSGDAGGKERKRRGPVSTYYASAISSGTVKLNGCDKLFDASTSSSSASDGTGGSKISHGALAAAVVIPILALALIACIASPCVWRRRWALLASFVGLFSKERAKGLRWRDDWAKYSDSRGSRNRRRRKREENTADPPAEPVEADEAEVEDTYTPAPAHAVRATLRSTSRACPSGRNKSRTSIETLPLYALPYTGAVTAHENGPTSPGAIQDHSGTESRLGDGEASNSISPLVLPSTPDCAAVRDASPVLSAEPPGYEELVRAQEGAAALKK